MWEMMPIGWDPEEKWVFYVDCAQPFALYWIPDDMYDTQVEKKRADVHNSVMTVMTAIVQTIGPSLFPKPRIRCALEPALSDNNSHISLPQPTPIGRSRV